MKKYLSVALLSISLCLGVLLSGVKVESGTKSSLIELKQEIRNEQLQAKLEIIRQKATVEVKNKVADYIKVQAAKIAEQKETAAQVEKSAMTDLQIEGADSAVDITSGASQSGREIGERNREYGVELSDPNLTQEQRQQIIQEKKEYNRSRR